VNAFEEFHLNEIGLKAKVLGGLVEVPIPTLGFFRLILGRHVI